MKLGLILVAALGALSAQAYVLPVCERTAPVRDFLAKAFNKTCDQVTEADLATLKRIAVPNRNVTAFRVGDFSGLPALEILNIKGNPITELPLGLMAGLPNLKTIVLFRTKLAALPDDFLEGMPLLENIHIFANPFTTIPEAVFERLAAGRNFKVLDFNAALLPDQQERLLKIFPPGGPVSLDFL